MKKTTHHSTTLNFGANGSFSLSYEKDDRNDCEVVIRTENLTIRKGHVDDFANDILDLVEQSTIYQEIQMVDDRDGGPF